MRFEKSFGEDVLMTYRQMLSEGIFQLEGAGVPDPEVDARELLEKACGVDRKEYLLVCNKAVSDSEVLSYEKLIAIRKTRKPLQQITGTVGFMGLSFFVNEHVLCPRQDTELLVEQACARIRPGMSVLDLCTGSGCILISLMRCCQDISGCGVDISEDALEVARINSRNNLVHPVWKPGDLFDPVSEERFDMIVSNPPYIPSQVIESLMPEVRIYEPRRALDGGSDGLDFYRKIIRRAPGHLNTGGWLIFEIGTEEKLSVETLMFERGFSDIHCYRDYAGNDRVVAGVW